MNTSKRLGRILLLILCSCLYSACSSPEKDKQVYYENALEHIKQDNREAAILELRSAIQLDAKFGEARYELGLLYLEEGEAQKAYAELVRAADLLPDNLDANIKVAFFNFLSGQREESRKRLEHILAQDPKHRDALSLLANLELTEGNYDNALKAVEDIGEEHNTSDELQVLKGRIYVAQKQWDKAEATFKRAIAIDGGNFSNYKTLLLLYETRKDKDKSKGLLDEIINRFPENAEAHLLQAGYFRGIGEIEKAGEELQKVIDIEPKNPHYRLRLANYYQEIGYNSKARRNINSGTCRHLQKS